MRLGKLTNDKLEELVLSKFASNRPEVLLPPGVGLDCSVLDLGDALCVLSSDPITGASDHLGALAVHVCCNDAASTGAQPVGIMTTLLLPPSINEAQISKIAHDIAQAAAEAGVDVLGGHTEVTDAVTRPIISATVLAKIPSGQLIHAGNLQVGDDIVMSKWAGLEGSIIIASDFWPRIADCITLQERSEILTWSQQLSVVREGIMAAQMGAHALHDVTEGGILGAVWEMAAASGCEITLHAKSIPIKEPTRKICAALGLHPLRLISSGSMLIGCVGGQQLCRTLREAGIDANVIGNVTSECEGVLLDGQPIDPPAADELWRFFESGT